MLIQFTEGLNEMVNGKLRKPAFWNNLMYLDLILLALVVNVSTGVSSVAVGLGVLIVLLQYFFTKELPSFDEGIGKVFVLYFLLQMVIAAFSLDPGESFRMLRGEFHRFFVLFFALMYLKDKKQIGNVLLAFVFSAFLNDVEAFRQGLQSGINDRAVIVGFNNSHTLFASQCLVGLPAALFAAFYSYTEKWKKYFSLFTAIFTVVVIFISGARGAWVALAVFTVMFVLLTRVNLKMIAAALVVMVSLTAGAVAFLPWMQNHAATIIDIRHRMNTERILMWESALQIIRDYPLHGIGQDIFGYQYNTKYISPLAHERAPEGHPEKGHGHPHNYILKITSEGGIIGFSAFLIFYGYLVYRLWCMYSVEYGKEVIPCGMAGLLLFIGILAEGMTDTNMNQVPIMRAYWLSMGIYFAVWECRQIE